MDLSSESISEANKEQFCVEMMKRLDIQRRNEQFCDVILEVGSGDDQARLKAHRIVLCAASPFFYNALNSDMKEKKEGVIRLEETSKAVMEEVLEYLYTGHVDINENNAFDLLQIADFLIAPSLKEISSKFISQTLSSSNCIKTFYFAERCDCPELVQSARDFVFANFMDVTQSDDFLNLSVTEVENWTLGDDIVVKGEEEVFQVIVKWVEKCETRKHSFLKLFLSCASCLRVTQLCFQCHSSTSLGERQYNMYRTCSRCHERALVWHRRVLFCTATKKMSQNA